MAIRHVVTNHEQLGANGMPYTRLLGISKTDQNKRSPRTSQEPQETEGCAAVTWRENSKDSRVSGLEVHDITMSTDL
jgi:hypothetical protein